MKIAPGVRLNVSKSGAGAPRGACWPTRGCWPLQKDDEKDDQQDESEQAYPDVHVASFLRRE
jgi:hypothetical protein